MAVDRDTLSSPTTRRPPLEYFRHVTRQAASPRFSFVDVPSSRDRSVLLLGSGRSGTTWTAELINWRNEFRTLWEPLNSVHSPLAQSIGFRWGEYLHPREAAPRLEHLFRHLLEGRVRSRWIDRHNTRRLPTRRLVKTIETTNLRDWLHLRFPEVPLVYMVRHPFAFAESHLALGWPSLASINAEVFPTVERVATRLPASRPRQVRALVSALDEPFPQLVLRWCIENAIALRHPNAAVHTLHYEHLVLDTAAELERLGVFTRVAFDERALERSLEPSRTDFRGRAHERSMSGSAEALIAGWQAALSTRDVDQGLRVLDAFGLTRYYDRGPLPLTESGVGELDQEGARPLP